MFGGAKINEIFESDFQKNLMDVNIFERTKDTDIYWTIKNYTGLQQTMYFNIEVFETFASKQVQELREPCLFCLSRVLDEMKQIVQGKGNFIRTMYLGLNMLDTEYKTRFPCLKL